jgi:hypothetical protein
MSVAAMAIGPDRHPYVGPGERRGVVDAITDHGHPRFLSLQHDTSAALSSGRTSCDDVEHPTLWATATAVGRASPVSMTTSKRRSAWRRLRP